MRGEKSSYGPHIWKPFFNNLSKHAWCFSPVKIIFIICILLILGPFCFHYLISKGNGDFSTHSDRHLLINIEDHLSSFSEPSCSHVKSRIQELLGIKVSVSTELRDLEQKRNQLQNDIQSATSKVNSLRLEESHLNTELQRLKMSLDQALIAKKELYEKNMPDIKAPFRLVASHEEYQMPPLEIDSVLHCKMHNCFDYSRCPILSNFPVYIYDIDKYRVSENDLDVFVKTTIRQAFGYNSHATDNPDEACIYVVLVGENVGGSIESHLLEANLQSLPHWHGDGRNHILLNLARSFYSSNIFDQVNTGRAIVVQSHFGIDQLRRDFDIVAPPLLGLAGGDLWHGLPPLVPAKRKFFLSFQGELPILQSIIGGKGQEKDLALSEELNMMEELSKFMHTTTLDKFYLQFSCRGGGAYGDLNEWQICGMESQRIEVLEASSFCLILTSPTTRYSSTTIFQTRLFECLKYGAIPVVLGNFVELPFAETIDWRKASIILPKARVSELHFYLRSISDADLLFMRRQGRLLWEHYLGSTQAVLDTILAVVRQRLDIPPLPATMEPSPSIFNDTFTPLTTDTIIPEPDTDESLGPMEPPFPSVTFKRNYSIALVDGYNVWNNVMDPFYLYPYTPTDPILPSEAQFVGSQIGFRPINNGAGGAGKEFSESLGGNSPREQFTIVMLTYEREQVLVNSLARLYGLPYLNKVIVVWNSMKPPPESLKWPDLKVPIKVLKAERNSLNNRFLPFSEIETEAILSVDDDAHLRHDEIVFGFRVWREERDRLVGFPGRFHAWDLNHGGWLYNSNYSCQLSMVLTGAAFFHKYYAYAYSQIMPQAIRDKVDEYMNCEDIAMNFLIAHMTRTPPVKVTSRWTFRCPGCPVSLSEEDSHFYERHKCISFFTQVYGYNPLLNTQYRVDSVLFKTRLPHDKQKCFKFI